MHDAREAFNRSVITFIQRQKRKLGVDGGSPSFCDLEGQALYLTCHTTHVLEQLHAKRQSLEWAIDAWDGCSKSCLEVIRSLSTDVSNILRETLFHWLTQYLRLRDGFVLLTNGECRHPADSIYARKAKKHGYCAQSISRLITELKNHKTSSYLSLIAMMHSSFSFPSELDVDPANTRKDGYTKLFKSKNGYSGYGWDELFNDEVGIRYRLLVLLYRMTIFPKSIENVAISAKVKASLDRIWEEDLIEKGGAQSFDIACDEHERKMHILKRRFEERCDLFIEQVNSIFSTHPFLAETATLSHTDTSREHQYKIASTQPRPSSSFKPTRSGKLVITKEDKFERLELKDAHNFGLSELIIQRQGDAFKVADKHGVLPSHMSVVAWTSAMKLPNSLLSVITSRNNNSKQKKVRRIVDEDAEPDEDQQSNKDTSSLKVVIVKAPMSCEESNKLEESIGDIKKQFGVDSVGLEQSREALEAEENQCKMFALPEKRLEFSNKNDWNPSINDDIVEIQDMIMDEREQVEMLKRVLQRVTDMDEIWDAHESLRESFMFLGNKLLSLHDLLLNKGDRSILFEAATCFQGSLTILKMLRKLVDRCFNGSTKDHIDFVKRTLILCRGRALINLGRTFLEQSKERSYRDSKRINDTIDCLNEAVSCAQALRAQCVCFHTSRDEKYTILIDTHKHEADELESMANKWLGLCFWHMGLKDRAINNLLKSIDNSERDRGSPAILSRSEGNVLHAFMKSLLEEFYGASSLINLATKEVDAAFLSQENVEKYQGLVATSLRGYTRAMEISDSLYSVARSRVDCPIKLNDLIHDHDIVSSIVLQEMRDSFLHMWEDKKTSVSSRAALISDKHKGDAVRALPRSDIFHSGFMPSNKNTEPATFIVDEGGKLSKEKMQNKSSKEAAHVQTDEAFDSFGLESGNDMHRPLNRNMFQGQITYRLWGDEVLFALGKDIHQYPSCCPERPKTIIH